MTKTFDESLLDTAKISMSMLDPEDIIDTTSEEFEQLRREQQGCHNELTNREDFPFNITSLTIKTRDGQHIYNSVDGKIKDAYIEGKDYKLVYNSEIHLLSLKKGEPTMYAVEYNPQTIIFYPTPDKTYNINIRYYDTKNVINSKGEADYVITTGSTLKMPKFVQHLYWDALEYYLLASHIKKRSNPRYEPTMKIANDRWNLFKKAAGAVNCDTYLVI